MKLRPITYSWLGNPEERLRGDAHRLQQYFCLSQKV